MTPSLAPTLKLLLARLVRGDEQEGSGEADYAVRRLIGRECRLGLLDDRQARRRVGLFLIEEPARGSEDAGMLGLRGCRAADDMKRPLLDLDAGKSGLAQDAAQVIGIAERPRPR